MATRRGEPPGPSSAGWDAATARVSLTVSRSVPLPGAT